MEMETKLEAVEEDYVTLYPEQPTEPLQSDCCGTGCNPCVFDIYEQEMKVWRGEVDRIRRGQLPDSLTVHQTDLLNTTQYKKFQIESVQQETRDSFLYRFVIPEYLSLGLAVGQHLILRGSVNGQKLSRQYTPVSAVTATGHFDILIKLYETGKMSQYIKTWKQGDEIEWRGPFGQFIYQANKHKKILMLAAGSGIAPMVQVIRGILDNPDDETVIQLVFACKTYDDILLRKFLDECSDYWNFSVLYAFSKENEESANEKKRFRDKIHLGRISKELLQDLLSSSDEVLILTCGTKSFDKDMIKYAKQLGFQDDSIFKF